MTQTQFAPHPGSIRMVEVQADTSRDVPIDEVPEDRRFVYLKDGVETYNPDEATERVPIVEVRMVSVDQRGNLVPKDQAARLVVYEIGPDNRPLRHTTMVRNTR